MNPKNKNENDEIKKDEIIVNPKEIISDCNCMQKATREIRELQLKDTTLTPYFQYLEEHKLPTSETISEDCLGVRETLSSRWNSSSR